MKWIKIAITLPLNDLDQRLSIVPEKPENPGLK